MISYMTIAQPLLIFAAAALAYALVTRRALIATAPLRQWLAREGERLIADPRMPEDAADGIRVCLNNPVNGWVSVWFALAMPLAIASRLFLPRRESPPPLPHDLQRRVGWFYLGFMFVNGAAFPIALPFVLAWLSIGILLMLPRQMMLAGLPRLPKMFASVEGKVAHTH